MHKRTPAPPSRQQRRALERALKKGQDLPKAQPLSEEQLTMIGDAADQIADKVAREQLGIAQLAVPSEAITTIASSPDGTQLLPFVVVKGGFINLIADELLRVMGYDVRLVAGRAMWSVGVGDADTFDHGYTTTGSIELDVETGCWHLWLELDGWLLDFSSRVLPEKLKLEHQNNPFSTPPHRWRRFPDVIRHDLGKPMPDPFQDRFALYGYWAEHPELKQQLLWRMRPARRMIRELVQQSVENAA